MVAATLKRPSGLCVFPPNSWRVGAVAAAGTAALAFIHGRQLLSWAYGDVTAAGAEYRQSMLTIGIFVAAVAAWVSSSIGLPTNAHVPVGAARRGGQLVAHQLGFLAAACGAGFTVGHAPVTLHAATTKVYGTFDVAAIASGYATLFAYIAFGYLVGAVTPRYFAVPIALGLAYVMAFFTSYIFSPVFDFDVISGLAVPAGVSVARFMFFAAAGGVAVLASSIWLRTRTPNEGGRSAVMVGVTLMPVGVLLYASASYSQPLVGFDDAKAVCRPAGSSNVCVHPARIDLLPKLVASVVAMSEEAGPVIFPPSDFVDATVASEATEGSSTYQLQIQGQRKDWLSIARADIASFMAGIDACYRLGRPDPQAQDVSSATAGWIVSLTGERATPALPSPGSSEQLNVLTRQTTTETRKSLEARMPLIRECAGHPLT